MPLSAPSDLIALPDTQYLIDLARRAANNHDEDGPSAFSELIDQIQHCWRAGATDRVDAAVQQTHPLPDLYRMMYLSANHAADTLQHARPNQEARLFSVPVLLDVAPDSAPCLDTETINEFVASLARHGLVDSGIDVVIQSRLLTLPEAMAPRADVFALHERLVNGAAVPLNVVPEPQDSAQRSLFFIVGSLIGTAVDVPSEIAVEEDLDHIDLLDWYDEAEFILAEGLGRPEVELAALPFPYHQGVCEGTAYFNRFAAIDSFHKTLTAHRVDPANACVELMSTASLSTFMVALQSGGRTLDVIQWDVADEPAEFREQRIARSLCELTDDLGLGDPCPGATPPGVLSGH